MQCKKCKGTIWKRFESDYVACVNCSTLVDTTAVQMYYKPVKSNTGKKPTVVHVKKNQPEIHRNTQICIDYISSKFDEIKGLKLAGHSFKDISKMMEPRNICTGIPTFKKFFMMEHERRVGNVG